MTTTPTGLTFTGLGQPTITTKVATVTATDPALTQNFPIRSRTLPDVPSTETTTLEREMSYNPQNWGLTFAKLDRTYNYLQARDLAGIDPTKSTIDINQLWARTLDGAPGPDELEWIVPFYPPQDGTIDQVKGTESALAYAIGQCKKLRLEIYGFANMNLADAIVARIRESRTAGGRPLDWKIMSNHDSYISLSGVKTTDGTNDVIDAKLANGAWKYPEFHETSNTANPNFILSSSQYRWSGTADGSRRIDHRKAGAFDDQVIFTGSTNWDDSSNSKQGNELHFIAQAGVVRKQREAFDRTWAANIQRGPGFYYQGL